MTENSEIYLSSLSKQENKTNFQQMDYKKVLIKIVIWVPISFGILIVSSFSFGLIVQLHRNQTVYLATTSPRRRTLPIAALSYNRFLSSSFANPGLRSTYNNNHQDFSYDLFRAQHVFGGNRPSIRCALENEKERFSNNQNKFYFKQNSFKQRINECTPLARTIALCGVAYYCGSQCGFAMPNFLSVLGSTVVALAKLKSDPNDVIIAEKLVQNFSNFESLYNVTKEICTNNAEKEVEIKETKLMMDIITEQKLAQSERLNSIQGDSSLREKIRSAHTTDFTLYGHKKAATLCRLDMMQQLFEERKIDLHKHYFERGLVQPISNLYLATAYLSWWYYEYPLQTNSDLFIQSFLCKVALITKDVSNEIEDQLRLEQPFDKVKDDFILLQVIGKAIRYFRKKIDVNPFDCLSNDLQQKLICDSFREGFRMVSEKDTLFSYDHQGIAKLVQELLEKYFID